MKNSNLRGLEEDLNRGIEYNKKHGGSPLKNIIRRPDGRPISHFNELITYPEVSKCKCGKNKFIDQDICGECYFKSKII